MCDTSTGVCFVQFAVSVDAESIADEYACAENFKQACLDGPIVKDDISMQCCNETDQCNAHLNPPLPFYLQTLITTDEDPTTTTIYTPMIASTGNGTYH